MIPKRNHASACRQSLHFEDDVYRLFLYNKNIKTLWGDLYVIKTAGKPPESNGSSRARPACTC
jgi:hypothetical protein